jgi:uncharacterized membrane protein
MFSALRTSARTNTRVSAIDAARGAAMFFVCVSHFASNCLSGSGYGDMAHALVIVSMVASPAFVLISGTVVGFYFQSRPDGFAEFRFRLVDRALFLLTIGHVVLGITNLPASHTQAFQVFAYGYITDSIAVASLIGPMFLQRVSRGKRIAVAASLFAVSWVLVLNWHPASTLAAMMEGRSFGELPNGLSHVAIFPAVPWLAVYLIGTALGEWIARWRTEGQLAPRVRRVMFAGIASSLLVVVSILISRARMSTLARVPAVALLLSPYQKWPPGPAYILFFGGAGVVMIGMVILLQQMLPNAHLIRALATAGESSLLMFVMQAYLFQVVPYVVRWSGVAFSIAYFVATLVLMYSTARFWNERKLNRVFTVGLPAMRRAWRNRSSRIESALSV